MAHPRFRLPMTTTIDFTRIRSAPKSRNDSFEALAVHLFRQSYPAPKGSRFFALRGECVFRLIAGAIPR